MILTRRFGALAARRTFTETPAVEVERNADAPLTYDTKREQASETHAA